MTPNPDSRGAWCLDPRSLSAFRVLLALALLFDLADRFILAPYMFCDSGFFPASSWLAQHSGDSHLWSLHLGLTSPSAVRAMIAAQMVLATLLLVGRLSATVSLLGWILLLSLNFRTPPVLYGGDYLASKLLLLSALVPACYGQRSMWLRAAVTAMFLAQITVLYAGSGIAKLKTGIWTDGSALHMATGMHAFSRPFASLIQLPEELLWAATIATPWVQIVAALLVWWPRARPLAALTLLGMNIGIMSLLMVGWFMLYASSLILSTIPSRAWDWMGIPLPPPRLSHPSKWERWIDCIRVVPVLLVTAVFIATSLENALLRQDFKWPPMLIKSIRSLDLYQRWNMFTSLPLPPGNWTVAASRDSEGRWINILDDGSPVSWTLPPRPPAKFAESHRWRSTVSAAFSKKNPSPLVGRALVDSWNRSNPQRPVKEVRLFRMRPHNDEKGYKTSSRYEWPLPPREASP